MSLNADGDNIFAVSDGEDKMHCVQVASYCNGELASCYPEFLMLSI